MVISYYISTKLTNALCDLNIIEKANIDYYLFCFEYTFDILLYNTSLVIIGALLHNTQAATLYMIVMFLLKTTAGGAHANSRITCSIFSYGLFFLILILSHHINYIINFSNLAENIALIYILIIAFSIVILAPVDHPNKRFHDKEKKSLKIACLFFIILTIIILLIFYHNKQEQLCSIISLCLSAILINQLIGIVNNRRVENES